MEIKMTQQVAETKESELNFANALLSMFQTTVNKYFQPRNRTIPGALTWDQAFDKTMNELSVLVGLPKEDVIRIIKKRRSEIMAEGRVARWQEQEKIMDEDVAAHKKEMDAALDTQPKVTVEPMPVKEKTKALSTTLNKIGLIEIVVEHIGFDDVLHKIALDAVKDAALDTTITFKFNDEATAIMLKDIVERYRSEFSGKHSIISYKRAGSALIVTKKSKQA